MSEKEVKNIYSADEQARINGDGNIQTIEDVIVWTFDFSFTYDPEDPLAESRNFSAARTGGARGQLHIYDEDGHELANITSHDGNYTYNFTYSFDGVSYNGQCVQTKN